MAQQRRKSRESESRSKIKQFVGEQQRVGETKLEES